MRDRRDDERSFRGPMGMGRDEDRFRDRDRDRDWERDRSWRREEDMGGSRWSGASGRGGYESRDEHRSEHRDDFRDDYRRDYRDYRGDYRGELRGYDRDGREREGGYGGGWGGQREHSGMNMVGRQEEDRQWGRDRERYDRDDYDDRPRNLGARDYETRHFGGGRGGFDRGYDPSGPGRSFGASGEGRGMSRGFGASSQPSGWQGSYGAGDYGRGASMGRPQGMQGVLGGRGGGVRGEGWGQRMGGSDLGFSYGRHEGIEDIGDRGPHYGKGPKGYKRSDERIREEVCDCIARQGHIDASDVEVKVENGTVVLTGTVGQRHHKRVLEQMVERLHGVDDVKNELRLKRDEATQARGREQSAGQNGDQNQKVQLPNGKTARA